MDLGGSQTRIWCFRGFGDLKPGFGSLKAFLKAANQALDHEQFKQGLTGP